MEKGFESWFRDQQIDWQSPDPNSSSAPLFPSFGNMVSPGGWFHGLPQYRQGLNPMPPGAQPATNGAHKKFLVFDQSGDQTTLIYSSGVGTNPTRHHFPSWNNPKLQSGLTRFQADECIEENDSRNKMHEDTEELNALLYSDDDEADCLENDETSTGQSPSLMKRVREGGEEEEVVSSCGPVKRSKLEGRGDMVISLEDTASSRNGGMGGFEEELESKRLRKEKMKETINVLQNLIPGDKNGKNALVVIDEAIRYLRTLKVKAKALGLDSL